MPVNLKQLAAELQLSTATVSLALRDNPIVAEKTRKKVQALAAERNYIKSNLGMALQSKKSRIIGYMIDGVTKTFYNEVLQGAGEAALEQGYGLLVGLVSKDDKAANLRQANLLLEKDVDALIVSEHNGVIAPYLNSFEMRKKPVVYCTCEAPRPHFSVTSNDFLGGELAVKTLAEFGHKKILVNANSMNKQRHEGNLSAARAAGIDTVDFKRTSDILRLLKRYSEITAIAAYHDTEACDIMFELKRAGYRIPQDISIIGYDDLPICSRPEFMLTTIAQQRSMLGYRAVMLSLDLIEKRNEPFGNIVLDPSVVLRESVARPGKRRAR